MVSVNDVAAGPPVLPMALPFRYTVYPVTPDPNLSVDWFHDSVTALAVTDVACRPVGVVGGVMPPPDDTTS